MENTNTPLNFWSQVWQDGVIRFHQRDYNSKMISFFKDIDLQNQTVLIPLAGKTNDILYFLERGAIVTAIEFVEQAIVEFFEDNKIQYTHADNVYESKNLKFYPLDFFKFTTDKKFDVLYDRASQVVFTPEQRPAYYQHVSALIDQKTILFLGALDHDGPADYGPPHKISQDEVRQAYLKMGIELQLFSEDIEEASEKMKTSIGITSSNVYYLTSHG